MTVLAYICGATALYAASLIPFLLLVDAEHLTPACVRRIPAHLHALPLTVAALLLILGGKNHA